MGPTVNRGFHANNGDCRSLFSGVIPTHVTFVGIARVSIASIVRDESVS
jgi:hypothetical protein